MHLKHKRVVGSHQGEEGSEPALLVLDGGAKPEQIQLPLISLNFLTRAVALWAQASLAPEEPPGQPERSQW